MVSTGLLSFTILLLSSPNIGELPGVDLKGLDQTEISSLVSLLGQGACPCDPKLSIVQCIKGKNCENAVKLAVYGAAKFREGLSTDQVSEAVIRKYIEDYVRYQFDVSTSPRKGAKNPRVTIVEFADFECPHCALMGDILDQVVKKYPSDVAIVFKQFPLPHHTYALAASRAAIAAQRQGKFWEMHDLIFANQTKLSNDRLTEFAKELGLDLARFKSDLTDKKIEDQIRRDRQEAITAKISGTPAIYVNGRMFIEDKTPDKINAYVERLLKEKK